MDKSIQANVQFIFDAPIYAPIYDIYMFHYMSASMQTLMFPYEFSSMDFYMHLNFQQKI